MSELEDLKDYISKEIEGLKEHIHRSLRPHTPYKAPEPTTISSDDPSLALGAPGPGPLAPVQASPFAEQNEGEPAGEAAPAESSEATSTPATDAESVVAPDNEITPSTENPPTDK